MRRRGGLLVLGLVAAAGAGAATRALLAVRRRQERSLTGAGLPLAAHPRRGPSPANARMLAPQREPRLLAAAARWQPRPPRSAPARFAAYAWAAPMTAIGLVVAATTGARPRLVSGVLLFPHARGVAGAVMRRRGFAGTALGHVVIATGEPSPALLAHELVHVRQAERLGPLLAPVYLGLLAVYGYARHPLERAARGGGRTVGDTGV